MKLITFEDSSTKFILNTFDKGSDTEGFLVEKSNPGVRVISPDGIEIRESKFGGIKSGSEIYFGSDLVSIIHLFDSLA